ncbi:sigma-70 family RNA polymerase sigma factor [Paenibacillus glycanilyticus]|uniref:sigma-70 family RNA polymerase sigma factor n=1 Tax=Paenibacillus glycanilyticus TaxID=126569 RepID=UPI00204051CA|nr:sigma-70 family RNA polymerase sigma factor [Paenibacillus glycanilyticus]MCM3626990.1 sigma-70 family RNA polymerase sigma factor [Paenibacillus glycanilyticus]
MRVNENNFIQRLQRKKEDALEFVIDTYLPLIKGVTHKVLAPLENDGMIEECINDIFISVWNNASKFTGGPVDFRKWICAVAKFKSIDYYRKASKKVEVISHTAAELQYGISAEDELMIRENKRELVHFINLLEPIDRNIFVMKFFLGLNTEEIGRELGLTRASVDNRIYRGKKRLYNKVNPGGHI